VSREFPERPIVGVGAIVLDGDRILLVRRANEPLKAQWSVPGGAVEVGETLDAAVAREVREETGIDVEVGPIVDVLDRIRVDVDGRTRFHYVLVDFLCRSTGGTPASGSDADAVAWARLSEMREYGVADGTVRVIEKAIGDVQSRPWVPWASSRKQD